MRLTWLADVLREAGLTVVEVPGWQTRGKELTEVRGVVWHHTATGTGWTNGRVADLLRDGRLTPGPSYLPGPLAQLGLQRDGTFVLVAAGKANHNGYGEWGNQSVGIEAYNAGDGEPWPAQQVDAFDRGTAAILAHLKLSAAQAKGHRETDPRRKIDPKGLDMDQARQRIAHLITYRPPAPIPTEDIDMTADELNKLLDAKLAPIVKDLAEVKRQVSQSQDEHAKGGRTLRHIDASILNKL